MSPILLKNRGSGKGFTLLELLVAMGVAAVLGIVMAQSYVVSSRISKHTVTAANISKNIASLQSYISYLITNAGAALVPEQAIRTYNDQKCGSTSAAFLSQICSSGLPKLNSNGTDVLVIAYGLPFTSTSAVDMTRYAAQLEGASTSTITLSKGSPLDSVVGTALQNLYLGRMFMVYSFSTPSAAYTGYVANMASTGTPPNVNVIVTYSSPSIDSPFNTTTYPDASSVFNAPGANTKMVMVDIEAIYLDDNGNIVDALWGPGGNVIVRTIASGVEVMELKYLVNGSWRDDVTSLAASTTSDVYRNLEKMRMGVIFTNYYSHKEICEDASRKVPFFGTDYTVHARAWNFEDPCGFYKVSYFEFPFKSIRSFVTALGG